MNGCELTLMAARGSCRAYFADVVPRSRSRHRRRGLRRSLTGFRTISSTAGSAEDDEHPPAAGGGRQLRGAMIPFWQAATQGAGGDQQAQNPTATRRSRCARRPVEGGIDGASGAALVCSWQGCFPLATLEDVVNSLGVTP